MPSENQRVGHSNNCSSIHISCSYITFSKTFDSNDNTLTDFISRILLFLYRCYIRQFGSGNSPFTKSSLKQCARYGRIKILSFMRLSGISPPAASFQKKPLMMFLKTSSVNGLNANFLLMEYFCFNLIILGWYQNWLGIMSVSSKMLSFGLSGHSNKSRFLVTDWKHLLLYEYQVKFYYF